MDIGPFFALLAAVSFSSGIVIVRRAAAASGESFTVTAISIFVGLLFFAVAVTLTGEWGKVIAASWQTVLMFVLAGIMHFVIGRLLGYNAYRLIGANKATPFINTDRFYTVLFCFLFLGEPITLFIIAGVLCMFLGAALTVTEHKTVSEKTTARRTSAEARGILLSLATALFWGSTPVLVKPGIVAIGSPMAGGFISYAASAVVMLFILLNLPRRRQLLELPFLNSLVPMILAGIFTAGGQLFYYFSLRTSPANVVTPLLGTGTIFIFLLSWMINRHIEVFSWKVGLGMAATVVGTFLLFL